MPVEYFTPKCRGCGYPLPACECCPGCSMPDDDCDCASEYGLGNEGETVYVCTLCGDPDEGCQCG